MESYTGKFVSIILTLPDMCVLEVLLSCSNIRLRLPEHRDHWWQV